MSYWVVNFDSIDVQEFDSWSKGNFLERSESKWEEACASYLKNENDLRKIVLLRNSFTSCKGMKTSKRKIEHRDFKVRTIKLRWV